MKFEENKYKKFFAETVEYMRELDKVFYDAGAGHLFTEKELRKLSYAAENDRINVYAYPVMAPTIKRIREFCDKMILAKNPPKNKTISNLVNNRAIRRGKNKGNKQDRGAIEILKDNIREYLENPTKLPNSVAKMKKPVPKNANQAKLKQPRVFTLLDKDELVKPNEQTMNALLNLEKEYCILIKANIEQKIDNQNPTQNYADRFHVSVLEELVAYKNAKVLLKKDDDKIRDKANELTKNFESYIKEKDTPLVAEGKHRTNIRQLTALKGNIKKAVRKDAQIEEQLASQGKTIEERVVPTEPIKENEKLR